MSETKQAQSRTMTLPDVCLRLGLSWPQAWRLVLRGELRARKEGGRWLCDVDQVERVRLAAVRRRMAERPPVSRRAAAVPSCSER